MKKLLLLLILFTSISFGQSGSTSLLLFDTGDSYQLETKVYLASLTTPLSKEQEVRINTFVVMLKNSLGVTSLPQRFDQILLLANETSEAGLKNLAKRFHDATNVNCTFKAWVGFRSLSSPAGYINTNYNPNTDKVSVSANNMSIGAYSQDNLVSTRFSFGTYDGTSYIISNPVQLSVMQLSSYFGSGTERRWANFVADGFHILSQNGSTSYKAYIDGESLGEALVGGSNLPNRSIYLFTYNNNGSPTTVRTGELSFYFVANGLSDAEVSLLTDCVEWYLTDMETSVRNSYPQISESTIIFTFDDGYKNVYELGKPMFDSLNVQFTCFIYPDSLGVTSAVDTYMTVSDLQALVADSFDVQCHTYSGITYSGKTEAAILADLDAVNAFFVANSLPSPEHHAYTGGAFDYSVIDALSQRRLTGRATGGMTITNIPSLYTIRGHSIDNAAATTGKALIDSLATKPGVIIFFAHRIYTGTSLGTYSTQYNVIKDLIEYAQSKSVPIKTMKQWYNDTFGE